MSLLANLAAYDFGYIPAGQLIERTANALATMSALERHQGHFYNWYDTQTLQPLAPLYISTVDSGNLAGHLLTLRPGLLALPDHKILGARLFDGLIDTLRVLVDDRGRSSPGGIGADRATAERSGVGLRFPPGHARCGADLAGAAGGVDRTGGREPGNAVRPRPSRRRTARSGGRRRWRGNAAAPWTS